MQDEFTIREEANAITCYAFRNGFIENLHAGEPLDKLEDSKWSRITDAEMKKLMIEASERIARLLTLKEKNPEEYWRIIAWQNRAYTKRWNKSEVSV